MKNRQQGVALITAVLIVAIVAAVAMSLAMAQQVWLRQTQNLIDVARAEKLRQGAFEFAAAVVAEDAKRGNVDHLGEKHWTTQVMLPTEGGVVAISIKDAQARINLNNLARGLTPTTGQTAQPPQSSNDVAILRQLLIWLNVEPTAADALVAALQDWLDGDSQTRPGGAEDLEYLNHDPPYRAANRQLASVEELRLVKGFNEKIIRAIRPYVIALPTDSAPINVNTAESLVIAALTGMDPTQAAAIARTDTTEPFNDVGAFQTATQRPNLTGFAVSTGYFIVSVEARIGRVRRLSEALIARPQDGKNTRVLWHWQPAFEIPEEENENDEAKS